ncbi:hypothetical protein F5Y19DRAFT_465543 [Xylariaceae sp. FL1651]|nr:hypothetical protein F5Y19DRAFT_465543 [Xylariaceae sp. FL1651]
MTAGLISKDPNGVRPEKADEFERRIADGHLYLDWLDLNIDMTPKIKKESHVDKLLTMILETPEWNLPEDMKAKAQKLLDKYQAEEWGQHAVVDEDPIDGFDGLPSAPSQTVPANEAAVEEITVPGANDPIFGVGGIMYGIMIDTSKKRRDYRFKPGVQRKSAKTYGHNGIALGTWFPFQINALFWGAHGARMGGIAGSVQTGAYSVVVAGTYEDLDTDYGDVLYYSGSNSHDNKDPTRAAESSQGTKSLHASIATGNPVRVLRSGGSPNVRNANGFLPSCGLRYDGLYRVVLFRYRTNENGGLYEQFKLERIEGQTPLAELRQNCPTADQVRALNKLRRGGN